MAYKQPSNAPTYSMNRVVRGFYEVAAGAVCEILAQCLDVREGCMLQA
jgi:hypothetical protein